MSNALAAFALARISEDEEAAQRWQLADGVGRVSYETCHYDEALLAVRLGDGPTQYMTRDEYLSAFFEPAESDTRQVAECKAKQVIVNRYLTAIEQHHGTPLADAYVIAYEAVVRDLVSVWEDHPDFDPDWSW